MVAATARSLVPFSNRSDKSTKNFFPQIDEPTTKLRQPPDAVPQKAVARKIVEREFDQVLRMWVPCDDGFLLFQPHVFQPHVRNASAIAPRRTDGYGSPMISRAWLEK